MKGFILTVLVLISSNALAEQCRRFTQEQRDLIRYAYVVGSQYDSEIYNIVGTHAGHSLAAILIEESFVGEYIIRVNASDGLLGSYGIMMVQITTIFHMDGLEDTWVNRQDIAPNIMTRLLTDDLFAIESGYRYLRKMILQRGSLWEARRAYNGAGSRAIAYADRTGETVRMLIKCGI